MAKQNKTRTVVYLIVAGLIAVAAYMYSHDEQSNTMTKRARISVVCRATTSGESLGCIIEDQTIIKEMDRQLPPGLAR